MGHGQAVATGRVTSAFCRLRPLRERYAYCRRAACGKPHAADATEGIMLLRRALNCCAPAHCVRRGVQALLVVV